MAKGVHDGHRKRVKQEFLKNGFNENTPPHKILEMLLFYSIPRGDTNVLAHNLLNEFGSITGVLNASTERLLKIKGIGPNSASLIKLTLTVLKSYMSEKGASVKRFGSNDDICEYINRKYIGFTKEIFSITSLAPNGILLGFDFLSEGTPTDISIPIRLIAEIAIKRDASSIILAHNHPNGVAFPTPEDVETTIRIKNSLKSIDISLLDHMIIGFDDYISMKQSYQYAQIFS